MKVRTKLILGFSLVVVLIWITISFAMNTYQDIREKFTALEEGIVPRSAALLDVEKAADEVYYGVMEGILSEDAETEETASSLVIRLEMIGLSYVGQVTLIGEEEQILAGELMGNVRAFNSTITEIIDLRERGASPDELMAKYRETSLPALLALREKIEYQKASNIVDRLLLQADFHDNYTAGRHSLFLSAALITLLAAAAAFLTTRSITKPLHTLHKGTEVIAQGNLDHKVGTRAKDEIGQLSRAFDQMTLGLTRTMTSVDNLNQEITERKRMEELTRRRLEFEELISEISSRFVSPADINDAINRSLADIGRFSNAGRAYLFLFREDGIYADNTHEWCAVGVSAEIDNNQNFLIETMQWMISVRQGELFQIGDVSLMPVGAGAEKALLESQGIKAILLSPVYDSGKRVFGFMGLDDVVAPRKWSDDVCTLLRMSSQIIGNAIERNKAEELLRRSEERFSKAFRASPDMVVISRIKDGKYLEVNDSFTHITGYTSEEVIGHNSVDVGIWRKPEERARIIQILQEQGRVSNEEINMRTKSGEIRVGLLSAEPINIGGEPCMISVNTDITERKAAEEKLKQAMLNLENSSAQLAATNKELEAFSYAVSHDLRTPLRTIDGFSQALLEDYQEKLDEQAKDYLGRLRGASQKMGELIDGLLKLSRLTRSDMHQEKVDLSAMVKDIASTLKEAQPKRQRQVDLVISPGLTASGDRQLLRALLENLLGNAWKFTGKCRQARIEFGATQDNGKSAYFVRDNGAGFDMTYADKLFGAFQRLHDTTDFPGTGIGLATVQRIINRHGGHIWAEGAVGKGATFYFTLN